MLQYGCSRMTVSRALGELVTRGMIVRRRRAGSFVAAPPVEHTVLRIPDIAAEVHESGAAYRFDLLARSERTATTRDRARLDTAAGARILALRGVHMANEQPLLVEDRLIDLSAIPAALDADFCGMPPGTWLLQAAPWTQAEHRVRAVNADADIARMLAIAPGTACLVVERRTWQSGRPVTQVVLTYPGDSHQFVARFSPTAPLPPD